MAFYESVVIARPELTETQIDKLINDLSEIIENNNGKVVKREQWGLRSFAYKIKKNKKGHYFMLNVDSAPTTILEYERQMLTLSSPQHPAATSSAVYASPSSALSFTISVI